MRKEDNMIRKLEDEIEGHIRNQISHEETMLNEKKECYFRKEGHMRKRRSHVEKNKA